MLIQMTFDQCNTVIKAFMHQMKNQYGGQQDCNLSQIDHDHQSSGNNPFQTVSTTFLSARIASGPLRVRVRNA